MIHLIPLVMGVIGLALGAGIVPLILHQERKNTAPGSQPGAAPSPSVPDQDPARHPRQLPDR